MSDTVTIIDGVVTVVSVAAQGPTGIQGPQGPVGPPGGTQIQRTAAVSLAANRMIILNGAGLVDYATASDISHAIRVVGMTASSALPGAPVSIQTFGEVTLPTWNWLLDKPIYLSDTGTLTQVVPVAPAAKFLLIIGFPVSSTTIFVKLNDSIYIA